MGAREERLGGRGRACSDQGAQALLLSSEPKSHGMDPLLLPRLADGPARGPASNLPGPAHLSDSVHSRLRQAPSLSPVTASDDRKPVWSGEERPVSGGDKLTQRPLAPGKAPDERVGCGPGTGEDRAGWGLWGLGLLRRLQRETQVWGRGDQWSALGVSTVLSPAWLLSPTRALPAERGTPSQCSPSQADPLSWSLHP